HVKVVGGYPGPPKEVWATPGSGGSSCRKLMELVPGHCRGPLGKALCRQLK
ncbi:hypothetical protein NDU88_003034, partial [Pleurodeles waltl]